MRKFEGKIKRVHILSCYRELDGRIDRYIQCSPLSIEEITTRGTRLFLGKDMEVLFLMYVPHKTAELLQGSTFDEYKISSMVPPDQELIDELNMRIERSKHDKKSVE